MAQQQGPNKRTTIVLCVILGILAVVAVFRFASLGGGGDDSGSTSAPPAASKTSPTPPAAEATTVTTEPPGEPTVPSGDFDALATRDPFEPLVDLTPPQSSASPASTTSAGEVAPAPTPAPTAAPTPAPSGTRVLLVDIVDVGGVLHASLQVNGQPVTVAPGQMFGTSFKLVSIEGTCAQLLYGDAAFSLCKGEEAVK